MPVTKDQAQRLADLAREIRPFGARHWDTAGIRAAITRVEALDLAEVSMVVIRGAADRTLDTPAAIGNTSSPLWQTRWRNPEPAIANPTRKTYCSTHGTEINLLGVCKSCAADQLAGDRHPERSNA